MNFLMAGLLLFFAQSAAPADSTALYYLVFLRPDPARKPLPQSEGERIMAAHMANILGMAQSGVLVAAGPFEDKPPTISGIFIMKTTSLDEARRIAAQDPTVVEHRNTADAHPWRGPKGIGEEYVRLHKEKPDTPEGMGVQPFCMLFRGPAWADRKPEALREHAAYVTRQLREGKMAMAGHTENDDELAGVVVFNRIADEDAQRLMAEDPAVKAGVLRFEYHRWWCAEHVLPR